MEASEESEGKEGGRGKEEIDGSTFESIEGEGLCVSLEGKKRRLEDGLEK